MFTILLTTLLALSTYCAAIVPTEQQPQDKPTIVIGLHRQVLDFNPQISYLAIGEIALFNPFTLVLVGSNKKFRETAKQLWGVEKRGTEFILDKLAQEHDRFAPVKEQLFRAIHQHTVNPHYVDFINRLRENGFNVILVTCAGERTLNLHAQHNPAFFAENEVLYSGNLDDYRGNASFWTKVIARANGKKILVIERDQVRQEQAQKAGIEAFVAENADQARAKIEERFGPLK